MPRPPDRFRLLRPADTCLAAATRMSVRVRSGVLPRLDPDSAVAEKPNRPGAPDLGLPRRDSKVEVTSCASSLPPDTHAPDGTTSLRRRVARSPACRPASHPDRIPPEARAAAA